MPEYTLQDLHAMLDQMTNALNQVRGEMRGMSELVKIQNKMLDICIKSLDTLADPRTGADWLARSTAINALKQVAAFKLPDAKTLGRPA